MNILNEIVINKKREVEILKELIPIKHLERSEYYNKPVNLLSKILQERNNKVNIIAEFKRKSPSKGVINNFHDPLTVANLYLENGAVAMSILTDEKFFGGKKEDFAKVRSNLSIPLLRKDFIIDEYQVIESKAMGADVILLIAACLKPELTYRLTRLARSLNMDVLLELHDEDDLEHINEYVTLIGINNRSLKTFEVDINTSLVLGRKISESFIKISESGLNNAENIYRLMSSGFKGFLIGEYFMKKDKPGVILKNLIENVNKLLYKQKVK